VSQEFNTMAVATLVLRLLRAGESGNYKHFSHVWKNQETACGGSCFILDSRSATGGCSISRE
jgi:hypothetical protein